jgi:hypothetical protein
MKKFIKNLTPIVNISPLSENFARKIGFVFTDYFLAETSEGWPMLHVEWSANEDYRYKLKYAQSDATGSGPGNETQQFLSFKGVYHPYYAGGKKRMTDFVLELGINYKGPRLQYRVSHFDNIKYGVCVYFSPYKFGSKYKTLTSWRNEEFWAKFDKENP